MTKDRPLSQRKEANAAAITARPAPLIQTFLELDAAMRAASLKLVDALAGVEYPRRARIPNDETRHFPEDDVFDSSTGAQYFLHRHPAGNAPASVHVHFFQRWSPAELNLSGTEKISTHLAALELNAQGEPHAWFAVNQWVVGDYWQPADDTVRLFKDWNIAKPEEGRGNGIHEIIHRWLSAYLLLNLSSTIYPLLSERDEVLDKLVDLYPATNVLEDRAHEILGYRRIDFSAQMHEWKQIAGAL